MEFLNGFGALRLSSPVTCCLKNALLTPLSCLIFVDWQRLVGLTTSHCKLHCVALMGPCVINDLWCSEVHLNLNWVFKVKRRSWFPPDCIRCWRYDLFHPRWQSDAIIFSKSLTWPKPPLLWICPILMMMIAFIIINSGLVPLIEGLYAQILYFRFEMISGLCSHLLLFFSWRKIMLKKKAVSPRSHPAS